MKKSNLITLLTFAILSLGVIVFSIYSNNYNEDNSSFDKESNSYNLEDTYNNKDTNYHNTNTINSDDNSSNKLESSHNDDTASYTTIDNSQTLTDSDKNTFSNDDNLISMSDALFIGDSRTVGIMEYSGLNDADFFCSTGMSVFDVLRERISVPNVGKVTLKELLTNKTYGKIYIMLGINELGYEFNNIINKYTEVLDFITTNQPNTPLFIQANLHVSKKRSDSDDYINNSAIDNLNSTLAQFANNSTIFYIDANYLFDDEGGNLSADKTSDNAHLYAKYYLDWGKWICTETSKYIKEE